MGCGICPTVLCTNITEVVFNDLEGKKKRVSSSVRRVATCCEVI